MSVTSDGSREAAAVPPQSDPVSGRGLLVHVGYHKTATTWLQNIVFMPSNGYRQLLDHDEIFAHLITPHGLDFDPAPVRGLIAARRAAPAEGTVADVISLEALSGLPYDGGRESDAYAARLAAVVPQARILITIREQTAILASVYMQHLFRAGTASPRLFFDEAPPRGFFKFSAENFCYHRLVGLYQELFGADNVLVLPQEEIAADQTAAVARLARFSGNAPLEAAGWRAQRERGTSYPQVAVPLLRRANHLRAGPLNPNPMIDLGGLGTLGFRGVGWLARKLPARLRAAKPVSAHLRARFAGRFADSNRRLAAMLHHPADLSAYEGGTARTDADSPQARG
jgi:hypothetical protein